MRRADKLAAFVWRLCRNPVSLNLLEALGPLQASVGIGLRGVMSWKYDFYSFSVTRVVFGEWLQSCAVLFTSAHSVGLSRRSKSPVRQNSTCEPPLNFRHTQHFASLEMSHFWDAIFLRSLGRSVTCVEGLHGRVVYRLAPCAIVSQAASPRKCQKRASSTGEVVALYGAAQVTVMDAPKNLLNEK